MKKLFVLLLTTVIIGCTASGQSILFEGFEGSNMPPTGWIATSSCDFSGWYGWMLTSIAHSGSESAFIDYSPLDTPHNSYLITPQLSISGHKILSFWHASSFPEFASSTMFTLEISTTGTNPADFTVVSTIPSPSDYDFANMIFDLSAYNGQNIYIAFHIVDDYGTGIYLDDIDVYEQPECVPPANLTVSNVDFNEATLTWDAPSLTNSYTIEYIPYDNDWSNATSLSTTNNFITINNLQQATYYQARIQSNCGGSNASSWSQIITFTTLCDVITLDQDGTWTENFESVVGSTAVALNSCWSTPQQSATYHAPYVFCGLESAAHSGVNSLEMRGNNNETNIVVLPAFTNDLSTLKMSFFANTTAPVAQSAGTLEVGYITDPDDPLTFVAIETVTPKPESFSRQNSVPYGPFYFIEVDTVGRIAIRFKPNAFSTSWNFDDFTVSVLSECTEPIYQHALNVTDASVDLTWVSKEGYVYDVLCWPSGTEDTTYYYNVTLENGLFHIDSLMPSTSYSWIARTVCPDSTYSYAATRGHFNTPNATLSLPYLCDFEDTNHDYSEEFSFSGTGPAQWYIGTAAYAPSTDGTPSSRSLYISEDEGLTNSYSTQNNSYAYAVFDVNFPNEAMEYHLEFDLRVNGECSWDEFSVYMLDGGSSVPTTNAPSGVTLLPPTCSITQWSHYNLILPDVAGTPKRIVFYWHNDNYIFGNPPAAIDNIIIIGNSCARPSHLEISNLMEDEVTLTWQENATATSWVLYLKDQYSEDYEQIPVDDSTYYVLQNLLPNTEYVCFVKANCDEGETSNPSNPISFRTQCSANGISNLPYIEDFEDYEHINGSDYVPCWSRLNSSVAHFAYVNHMDFESSCLDFHYTPNCYTIAVLPMFNASIPLSSLMLTMDVRRHNLTLGTLEVGAMSDPSNAGTFEVIDTVNLSSTYEWINKTIYCDEYAGDAQYLAFRVKNAGNYTVAIDNLVVDHLPSCLPPSHIAASDITENTAQISWTGYANFFRVYLIRQTDTLVYEVTENSIDLTNLTPSTVYSLIVQSYCDNDTSDLSNRFSFTTQCGPITIDTDNPWFERFENYTGTDEAVALSPCWATPNTSLYSGFTFPTVFNSSAITHSGRYSLEIKGPTNMFVLPEFTNDLSTLRISLWGNTMAEDASTAGTLQLGVITDVSTPSSFVSVATIPATAFNRIGQDAPYTNFIGPYDFSSVDWQPGMRIAFRYQNSYANNSWNLDDITVEIIPSCTSPEKHSVTIDNITDATATIHWVDNDLSHDTWCVYYKPVEAPNDAWQMDTAYTDQFLTISGLMPNTTYEVYVISFCGTFEFYADATLKKQFVTTQTPVSIPYSTDFSTPNEWRLRNGDCGNYWIVRNTTPTGNNHALFITNNGVTPGYDVTSTSIVTAEKLFTVGQSSQILIEYDINVGGEAIESWDYDYMKMFFAPSTVTYEGTTTLPDWAASTNDNYAFNFSDYLALTTSNQGTPYAFSLTQGNVVHITAVMNNPNISPNESSVAKLIFAWVNDYIDGTQPGAVITNLSVTPLTCPQPSNLNVTNIESTQADIYWIAGQDETTWNLEYKQASNSNWTSVTVTSNSYHLSGLTPNTTYNVRLQADCGGSTSPYLLTTFNTSNCGDEDQCGYTFIVNDSYGDGWNGAFITVIQNGVTVNYVSLTDSYTDTVPVTLCDNASTVLVWNAGQYDSECSFSLIGPDGSYLFTISNLNTITNPSLFSFTTNCSSAMVCESPNNLSVSNITEYSAKIAWSAPNANAYVLQYRKENTNVWSPDIYTITHNRILTGLESNTTYVVRVKGECSSNNWSDWSDIITFSTLGDTSSVIEPTVTTNAASAITTTSAQLNGAITDAGNQTILSRGFEWKASSDNTFTVVNSTNSGTTFSATITNLTPNTSYTFRAFATTANATSYGQEETFSTAAGPTCDAPTGLDTVTVSEHFITIHWTDNADASQWNVQYRIANADWVTETAYATSHTIAGLEMNTTYQIHVRANCGSGIFSDWSEIIEVLTKGVGIDEYLLGKITLYPNPAKEIINVQCTMNDKPLDVKAIEVFDVYGKLIKTVNDIDNPTSINVSGLANGMYFVRVTTEQGVATKSFVKKN